MSLHIARRRGRCFAARYRFCWRHLAADRALRLRPSDPSVAVNHTPVEPPPAAAIPVLTGPPGVLVGAGDIGMCGTTGAEATARLLDAIAGTVFTTGDNAYMTGTSRRVPELLRAVVGTAPVANAAGARATTSTTPAAPGTSATSATVPGRAAPATTATPSVRGACIALNSEISSGPGSAQMEWLRAGARHPAAPLHRGLLASAAVLVRAQRRQPGHARPVAHAVRRQRRSGHQRPRSRLRTLRAAGSRRASRLSARHPPVHHRHRRRDALPVPAASAPTAKCARGLGRGGLHARRAAAISGSSFRSREPAFATPASASATDRCRALASGLDMSHARSACNVQCRGRLARFSSMSIIAAPPASTPAAAADAAVTRRRPAEPTRRSACGRVVVDHLAVVEPVHLIVDAAA